MSVSLRADPTGSFAALQLNGADKLLLNADSTLSGVVHPTTGDRSLALMTMRKLLDEFGALLSPNGYQKLPSGLIIQWGQGAIYVGTAQTATFSTAFPTGCVSIVINCPAWGGTNGGCGYIARTSLPTKTGFNIFWDNFNTVGAGGLITAFWIAVGY